MAVTRLGATGGGAVPLAPRDHAAAHGIRAGTKFLLVEGAEGRLWLQRLDPKELEGVDLGPLIARVRAEVRRLAAERYPVHRRR